MKAKTILSLDSKKVMDFFMKSSQFHNFELPEYFVFDKILDFVRETIKDKTYEECIALDKVPDECNDVNIDILLNKDGRYAVRPIVLANPYLYYFLVREICSDDNWKTINGLFEKFKVPNISSCALPIIPKGKESFHNSTAIINWWNSMGQRSLELALEYRYMFVTDITNCYGSVNPQSFDWAFTLKDTGFETKVESPIAKNIQKYLRAFQQGRNIGIPQGSVIFDFIGEIILGYSDLLLHEAIAKEGIRESYEILRYRDDYRVFCNDKGTLEKISYILQQVLERLNFRMNSKKTMISDSIVTDSIKPDKLAYIYNTPIFNKKGCDFDSFEKHLLYILMFARQYQDSGSVKTMLSDIDKRIEKWLESIEDDEIEVKDLESWDSVELFTDEEASDEKGKDEKKSDGEENIFSKLKTYKRPKFIPGGSVRAMSAICTQIALENVSAAHYALRVLSRMVDSLESMEEKKSIISLVYAKLCNQPNSTYNQLWLQNITYTQDKKLGSSPYNLGLCQLVAGKKIKELWNNKWLKPELTSKFPCKSIVDKETLKKVTPVITFRETRMYEEK